MQPMPRIKLDVPRFIFYNLLAVFLALTANFSGVTSALLSTNSEYFASLKLDQLYPINGNMRKIDADDKYEFLVPATWLPDKAISLAEARERELPQALRQKRLQQRGQSLRPDSAYGPAEQGVSIKGKFENVSVIKSSVLPGFSLRGTLGAPKEAAEALLKSMFAREGAVDEVTYDILEAREEIRGGLPAYVFEYTVRKPDRFQHTICVIISRGNELFTMSAMAPQSEWATEKEKIETITNSFLVSST